MSERRDRLDSGCVIRLIDDDRKALDALAFMLRVEGYEVRAYESPSEFLSQDDPGTPGCLITDIRMAPVDGIQLFRELMRRGYPAPVLFLTALAEVDTAVEMLKEGAVDFLVKPVVAEKLMACVGRALRIDRERRGGVEVDARSRVLWSDLTAREKEIIRLVARGWMNSRVGVELGISVRTVEAHRASAMRKLRLRTPAQVAQLLAEMPAEDQVPPSSRR